MAEKKKKATFSKDPNKRFVNPYNFIPLMGKCERVIPEIEPDENYTGYFDCSIKLLTPLFIPNTSSSSRLLTAEEKDNPACNKEGWKGYDFFSYDDWSRENRRSNGLSLPPPADPVIPGSELRGAVRSVYEAAFKGCMSSVSLDRPLSRRTNEAKRPGILKEEDGKWVIHPCQKAMLNVHTDDDRMGKLVPVEIYTQWKEGQEIWIKLNGEYKKKIRGKDVFIGKLIGDYRIIENSYVTNCNEKMQSLREDLKKQKYVQGWLHKGETFSRKHHESVFYSCDSSGQGIVTACQSDIDRLKEILAEYRDPKKNRADSFNNAGWYFGYEVSSDGTPVYFSEIKDSHGDSHVYLSPACIGREAYAKTIGELLKNNGGYGPCTGEELCPACQIFGMVGTPGKNGTYACGSKIRVTDARLIRPVEDSKELFEKPIILPELGEPKPGAVEFYTKPPYDGDATKPQKGEGFWTYDYKHEFQNGKVTKQLLSKEQPQLRGRKYYWHSEVNLGKYKETHANKVSAMKQRIRPMKAGEPNDEPLFHFRLYFEQLSKQQLTELKWALDFGNAACAHKIGRAKPLGFGSIRIAVDSLHLREIDVKTGSWAIRSPGLEEFFTDSLKENEAMEIVQKMANWEKKPRNVRYPSVEDRTVGNGNRQNATASHQWFTKNKGTVSSPNFFKVLPEAKDDAEEDLRPETALYTLIIE